MQTVPGNTNECTYTALPAGIHELTLHTASLKALEQCFARLDTLLAHAPPHQPLLLLSDIRQSGVPRHQDLLRLALRLLRRYPQHPPLFNAVLHDTPPAFKIFVMVMEQLALLYRAQVRFFPADQRLQAIDWLLAHRD